jgi:hypothetical protein
MEFNRYDIIEAHYWFCADYHEGQWSEKYQRLCRISRYFSPGACSNGPSNENSQAIYDDLVAKEGA